MVYLLFLTFFLTNLSNPPGGNIECPFMSKGARQDLSIEVKGALFSLGDHHACQGDGEAGGRAMNRRARLGEVRCVIASPQRMIHDRGRHRQANLLRGGNRSRSGAISDIPERIIHRANEKDRFQGCVDPPDFGRQAKHLPHAKVGRAQSGGLCELAQEHNVNALALADAPI